MTRRTLLRRTLWLGAAAVPAVLGVACGSGRRPPESAFLAPTASPRAAIPPAPGPDPTAVGNGPRGVSAGGPVSAAAPDPTAATPARTPVPLPTSGPRQPNVLLVTIDTLRADRIGSYGFSRSHTPVLDQLASAGVRFDHALCQLPQTNPSHACLLTGLYASTNGVKVHMVDKLKPGSQTLASVFRSAGYQTAGIYSWVSLDPQFCGLDQGFQTYEGYVLNRSGVFANPALEQLAATYRQIRAAIPVVKTADLVLGASNSYEETLDGRADVTNAAVFKWLDAHGTADPFFLWVHYFDPHYPYAPPAGYDHLFGLDYHGTIDGSVATIHELQNGDLRPSPDDLARLEELYQGEIAFADAQLGKLLAYLGRLGIADDTVVVVTGDHGESFGEHGDWTHGLKVFETEIRVPLLMRYPRRLPAGVVVRSPTQLIDVMPTLLELTGLRAAQAVQGTSLLPVISRADSGADRAAFTELADDSFVSVLSWGDWKLIRNDANGDLQLYSLKVDEAEQRNLASEEPRRANELNARLTDLMKLSGASR